MTLEYLQNYWWLLVSVLGGILVFLLFVQGGQSMLLSTRSAERRELIVNSLGRKWELTFTTLVVFGGAAFASFPLFYSTSFGGAYWLWLIILFSFILQAVSYEFRNKRGNIYGTGTYDLFLFLNGLVGCVLLGVAVGMFFFGGEFTVSRGNLLDNTAPVISNWAPSHGFEAMTDWRNLVLGIAVFFLARTLACLYMINNIDNYPYRDSLRQRCLIYGGCFLIFFLWFLGVLFTTTGYAYTTDDLGNTTVIPIGCKYFYNYIDLWWAGITLLVGVGLTLFGWICTVMRRNYTYGIWPTGFGVFLVVASLFWVAGYNDTAFYPSTIDPNSSLTLRNASSSYFTLTVMSYVSLLIPIVVLYIAYVWHCMDRRKISIDELRTSDHKY